MSLIAPPPLALLLVRLPAPLGALPIEWRLTNGLLAFVSRFSFRPVGAGEPRVRCAHPSTRYSRCVIYSLAFYLFVRVLGFRRSSRLFYAARIQRNVAHHASHYFTTFLSTLAIFSPFNSHFLRNIFSHSVSENLRILF